MFYHTNVRSPSKDLNYNQATSYQFCNKVYAHSGVNSFWSVNNSVKHKINFVPWIVILIPLTVMTWLLCIPLYHTTHNLVKEKFSYFIGYQAVITYAVTNINHYK